MKQPLFLATMIFGAAAAVAATSLVLPNEKGASSIAPTAIPSVNAAVSTSGAGALTFNAPNSTEYIAGGHVNFYAFQFNASQLEYYRGFLAGNSAVASHPTLLQQYSYADDNDYLPISGTMVGDEYWAYVSESGYGGEMQKCRGLYKMNLETGEIGDVIRYDRVPAGRINTHYYQMSYDPITDYVYAVRNVPMADDLSTGYVEAVGGNDYLCRYTSGKDELVRVDPKTYTEEVIGTINAPYLGHAVGMAVSGGVMYFVRVNPEDNIATLYKMDLNLYTPGSPLTEEKAEKLGNINRGVTKIAAMTQSMTFNHTTHELWWAMVESTGRLSMVKIDLSLEKGYPNLVTMATTGQLRQWLGLAIPYQTAPLATPAGMTNFEYAIGENGAEEITFKWTNPTTTYGTEPLTDLKGINVYRDGELIALVEETEPGKQCTWTDNTLKSGRHSYKLAPVNAAGEGIVITVSDLYIGRDLPNAVTNIDGVISGNKLTLSWLAPWRGVNGGEYDKETLVYKVVRVNDGKVVAENLKHQGDQQTPQTVVDEAEDYQPYSYMITASTNDGEGPTVTSRSFAFGNSLGFPYHNPINNAEDAAEIQIVDGNLDNYTWEATKSLFNPKNDNYAFRYGNGSLNEAEEYLFFPEFKFEEGKQYEVRFFIYVTRMYDLVQNDSGTFEVVQGKERNVQAMNNVIFHQSYLNDPDLDKVYEVNAYITEPEKGGCVAIRFLGKVVNFVEVDDFYVVEHFPYDLAIAETIANENENVDVTTKATVSVRNYGQNTVDNAKVQIISAKDEVLGEADLEPIATGETKKVEVPWTPTEEGEMTIRARVVLDNDGNLNDNIGAPQTVLVAGSDAVRWAHIGEIEGTSWHPCYSLLGSSAHQTIYPAKMLFADDLDIFSIEYFYNNSYENFPEMTIQLSGDHTNVRWSAEGYTNYFSNCNELDLSAHVTSKTFTPEVGEMRSLIFDFDEPIHVAQGENLALRLDYIGKATPDNLNWIIFKSYDAYNDPNQEGKKMSILRTTGKFNGSDYTPYIRFAYKSKNGIGTITMVPGADFVVKDGVICSQNAGDFEVYDLSGRLVARRANTTEVAGLPNGLYVVRAAINGKTSSAKVIIK